MICSDSLLGEAWDSDDSNQEESRRFIEAGL